MNTVNSATLMKFTKLAADTLPGDWVIIGGTVMYLLGSNTRTTVDIDIAGPKGSSQETTIKLMEIAVKLGLPPEAINQAAAFFLYKIKNWEEHLVLVRKGKKGRIFRPDLFLFISLKVSRLSDTDLDDCLQAFKLCPSNETLKLEPLVGDLERHHRQAEGDRKVRLGDLIKLVKLRKSHKAH